MGSGFMCAFYVVQLPRTQESTKLGGDGPFYSWLKTIAYSERPVRLSTAAASVRSNFNDRIKSRPSVPNCANFVGTFRLVRNSTS